MYVVGGGVVIAVVVVVVVVDSKAAKHRACNSEPHNPGFDITRSLVCISSTPFGIVRFMLPFIGSKQAHSASAAIVSDRAWYFRSTYYIAKGMSFEAKGKASFCS